MFLPLRHRRAGGVAVCAVLGLASCLPIESDPSDTGSEQVLSSRPTTRHVEVEPNGGYAEAEALLIPDEVELIGAMAAGFDVLDRDVFEIGSAQAGDRILGEFAVEGGGDAVLGVLDDAGRLLALVDPTSSTNGPPFMDATVRVETRRLYVAVATRSGTERDIPYSVRVSIERGAGLPSRRPQVVVLDFQGGEDVRIGNRLPIDVPPFNAANIGEAFAGQTETIIANVLRLVEEDYAGLEVTVYRDSDLVIPIGERTVIHFGTYDERLLGLADNVDPYNTDRTQSAVLYTDSFAVFNSLSPGVDQISQALANVTSHEIGHLLGLRHTSDPSGIMDVTASARQMLLDQWFSLSTLHETVLSLGVQDAPSMLAWTLGGTAPLPAAGKAAAKRLRALEVAEEPGDFYVPRSQLMSCGCRGCSRSQDAGHAGLE